MSDLHVPDAPGTLPRPLTTFIGRDREIAAIRSRITCGDVRLLTLTGPGGVGKTRLALRVAEEVEGFPDGLWFVPLASIEDPVLVAPAIATAAGATRIANQDAKRTLIAFLQRKRALLILDNFEQILDAAPLVSSLLAACPAVTVLVTSRTRLNISGEQVYTVPPLQPLDPEAHQDTAAMLANDAVRLFVERAQARRADFALTEQNAATVADICRRLDGLPLGIELAAARVGVLSPQDLLRRLDARLAVLTDGARDQPGRLRSLRASIAWSYDLLSADEQALFRRLAVFAGPWTLEAVEAVVYGTDEAHELPVIDGVASLVDKNLVRMDVDASGEARYLMLESIREFAAGLLDASEDAEAVRGRLTLYLRGIATESYFGLFHPKGKELFARLEVHAADIWRALARLDHQRDVDGLIELAGPVGSALQNLGGLQEGRHWLERAVSLGRTTGSPLLGRGLIALGLVVHLQGEEALAWEFLRDGLGRVTRQRDSPHTFHGLAICGLICQRIDQVAEAESYQKQALAQVRTMPDTPWRPFAESTVLGHLGNNAIAQGNFAGAKRYFDEAIAMQVSLGFEPGTSHFAASHPIAGLADVARAGNDVDTALARYQRALRLARDANDYRATVYAIGGVAATLAATGQWRDAARLFGADEQLHRQAGLPFDLETMDRQRGLGLPEPWFRAEHPFGSGRYIRDTLWSDRDVPYLPVPDPDTAAGLWDQGRHMTLDEATTEALAATLDQVDGIRGNRGLTPRELEVLRLLVEGKSDTQIAEALFISRRTAATHVQHIYARIDVSSRAEAAAWAVRNGLA